MRSCPGWLVLMGMMILALAGCASPEPDEVYWTDIPSATPPLEEVPTPVTLIGDQVPPPDDQVPPPDDAPDPPDEETGDVELSLMQVEQAEVRVRGMAPAEVEVRVMGVLGDACTEFEGVEQAREGDAVKLMLWARRPADMLCAQIARVYERTVPLEGTFEAGTYRLVANDFETTFEVPEPGGGGKQVEGLAFVSGVDVLVMESYPAQVALVVSGWVPDGCTRLAEIRQEREGNTVTVTMTTQRPSEMMCTQAIVEFEERVKLEGGFEPGEYVVRVNDFEVTFGVD